MIELIPAIDLIDGKCVRLTQGDYETKKVYNEDPLEVAKAFEDNGIRRLHVVDLDGAREGRIINHRTLERLATRTSLVIDFGGGLKAEEDVEIAFESGAQENRHQRLGRDDRPRADSLHPVVCRERHHEDDLHGHRS